MSEPSLILHDTKLSGHAHRVELVAHAPEGGLSLGPYASVRIWLARVEALPRFAPMPRSPLPEAA